MSVETLTESAAPARTGHDRHCHVRVLTTNQEFDALEGEWNRLLAESSATIFQTYEWQRCWWKHFATRRDRLHILLFVYEGTVVGIAPLYKRTTPLLRTRHLQCIGHGLSDYANFIVQAGREQMVFAAFALYLHAAAKEWDVLDIEDVNESTELFRNLPGTLENQSVRSFLYQGNVCPAIELPASVDALLESLGSSSVYNFKRKSKRLQQNFASEVTSVRDDRDDIEQAIETFSRIHGERWKSLGHPSAFDDPELRAFHVEFSRKFARRGWLRMFFLNIDGVARAVNYSFHYRDRIYMYHSNAHGPDEVMKCSPGLIIRKHAIEQGIAEGMKTFDFLRGDESYKYSEWKAVDSKNYLLRFASPTLAARLRFLGFLVAELGHKAVARSRRELYDYRRFLISKPRSPLAKAGYLWSKTVQLAVLAYNFVLRHIPIRAVGNLQIKQRSSHETVSS